MIEVATNETTMKARKRANYTPSVKDFPMLKYKDYGNGNIKKHADIEFNSYSDLANKIHHILEITKIACFENSSPDLQYIQSVSEVIEFIQRLLPFDEFQLLDKLQDMVIEENANNEFQKIVNQ